MKRIAIDITHYGRMSGYGVVTRNIVKGLLQADTENFYVLISNTHQKVDDLKEYKNFEVVNTQEHFALYKFFTLPKHLKKYHIDIFFSLDQTLPFKKVCKYIVVEHDVGPIIQGKWKLFKQLFNPMHTRIRSLYYLLNIEKFHLKHADVIISPSQFTKDEILNYHHINPEKIHVIPRGMNHTFQSKKKYKKKNQILLPFSNLHSQFIYELANEIIQQHLAKTVLLIKPSYSQPPKFPLLDGINIIRGRISDTDNEKYYKESQLSIYLSEYDGFGIAPLESMRYETPVIYNDIPCVKEISAEGGAACPLEIQSMVKKIQTLLQHKLIYISLLKKGTEKVKKYCREHTIHCIMNLLK